MKKIRKNDEVIVITGKDKGKIGEVLQVLDTGKVIVKGVAIAKKHTKPNPNLGVVGGIVEKAMPIDVSNVAVYNKETKKADRVGFKVEGESKVRVYKSTGKVI